MPCIVTTTKTANTAKATTTTHLEQLNSHFLPLSNLPDPKPTMFQRLADWLWPQVYDNVDYYYYVETNPQNTSSTTTTTQSSLCRGSPCTDRDASLSDIACRSCRVQGLECDRQLPHCSQCRDQQALCFFVPPLPRLTKSPAKSAAKNKAESKAVPPPRAVQV